MGTRIKLVTCAILLGVGILAVMDWASAAPPPPPRLSDLIIENQTDADVVNVVVKLYCATSSSNYEHIDSTPCMKFKISRLAGHTTCEFNTSHESDPSRGVFAIARVVLEADCPNGNALPQPADIVADFGQWEPQTPNREYAGFCSSAPAGETDEPTKIVISQQGTQFQATLSGRGRWRDMYFPLTSRTYIFP